MVELEEKAFGQQLQRLETLIHEIESFADPRAQRVAREAIQTLMDLHGAALERMMEVVAAGADSEAAIERFAADEMVSGLLLLYGLHPLDLETRVLQALDKVRPYLRSHGGNVELLGIVDGMVRLRMEGSCHGCPSSAMTLKLAIEEALYAAAPDIAALEVEGVVEPPAASPNFIPLELVSGGSHTNGNGWIPVNGLQSLAEGDVRTIDVGGQPVLFCRLGETFFAYSETCAACGQKLRAAYLEATTLVCPTCRQRYDVMRAGRCLDQPSLQLEPFPLLIEHGRAKIAVSNLQL